jgi:hypothetical protein
MSEQEQSNPAQMVSLPSKVRKRVKREDVAIRAKQNAMATEQRAAAHAIEVAEGKLAEAEEIREVVADNLRAAEEVVNRVERAAADVVLRTNMSTNGTGSRIDELFKQKGVDPAEKLIELAEERDCQGRPTCSRDQLITIWSKLMEYHRPKLSAIKTAGQIDHSLTVVVRKTLARVGTPEKRANVGEGRDAGN